MAIAEGHNDEKWLVKSNSKISGPFTFDEIVESIVHGDTHVLDEIQGPFERWRPIRDYPLFSAAIARLKASTLRKAEYTLTDIDGGTAEITNVLNEDTKTLDVLTENSPDQNVEQQKKKRDSSGDSAGISPPWSTPLESPSETSINQRTDSPGVAIGVGPSREVTVGDGAVETLEPSRGPSSQPAPRIYSVSPPEKRVLTTLSLASIGMGAVLAIGLFFWIFFQKGVGLLAPSGDTPFQGSVAEKDYRASLSEEGSAPPKDKAFVHTDEGERALNAGDLGRALSEFRAAGQFRPGDPEIIMSVAALEIVLGDDIAQQIANVEATLLSSRGLAPVEKGKTIIGLGYDRLSNHEKAMTMYREALSRQSG